MTLQEDEYETENMADNQGGICLFIDLRILANV